ncbi:hypothetical protein MIR68_003694 [Amoeboaphelidium protococcarum]|nr:hypothetical protein MIR68_003694 [Amoeboaphelidium protococcarum]
MPSILHQYSQQMTSALQKLTLLASGTRTSADHQQESDLIAKSLNSLSRSRYQSNVSSANNNNLVSSSSYWQAPDDDDDQSEISISDLLRSRKRGQVQGHSISKNAEYRRIISDAYSESLQERKLENVMSTKCDKIFASHWINDSHIVIGTKCSKLIVINTLDCLQTPIQIDLISNNKDPMRRLSRPDDTFALISSGIRTISLDPSRRFLLASGSDPKDIALYSAVTLEPLCLFGTNQQKSGHNDVIFGSCFVSDKHFITCGRDQKIALCRISDYIYQSQNQSGTAADDCGDNTSSLSRRFSYPVVAPEKLYLAHNDKVRDIKYDRWNQQFMTLSTDASVKLWDVDTMKCISRSPLVHSQETVCLSVTKTIVDHQHLDSVNQDNTQQKFYARQSGKRYTKSQQNSSYPSILYAVGSQSHVSFIDTRCADGVIKMVESRDNNYGVRSLTWTPDNNILLVGGGCGRISLYDMRGGKFQQCGDNGGEYFQTGSGYLEQNRIYHQHFSGQSIPNAVYTMEFDPSGSQLFCGGGPLQCGLVGNYASLWQ